MFIRDLNHVPKMSPDQILWQTLICTLRADLVFAQYLRNQLSCNWWQTVIGSFLNLNHFTNERNLRWLLRYSAKTKSTQITWTSRLPPKRVGLISSTFFKLLRKQWFTFIMQLKWLVYVIQMLNFMFSKKICVYFGFWLFYGHFCGF